MSVNSVFKNLRNKVHYHGWATAIELLAVYILRKFIGYERVFLVQFDRVPPWMGPVSPDRVRVATADEVKTLALDPEFDLHDFSPDRIDALYAKGHRCIFCTVLGKIAGYSWMTIGEAEIPKVGIRFLVRPSEGYTYKGFTHPDFRGHRLANDRYLFWLAYLKGQGRSALLCDFSFDNKATLTRMKKLNLTKTGAATLVALGRFHKLFLSGDFKGREIRFL